MHDFDIIRWVTGREVTEVYAVGGNRGAGYIREAGDADTTGALLTLDDGTLAVVSNSRHSFERPPALLPPPDTAEPEVRRAARRRVSGSAVQRRLLRQVDLHPAAVLQCPDPRLADGRRGVAVPGAGAGHLAAAGGVDPGLDLVVVGLGEAFGPVLGDGASPSGRPVWVTRAWPSPMRAVPRSQTASACTW
ncbi:hypothetical protein SGRIM128S_09154 [Streptomyces griseomycini]